MYPPTNLKLGIVILVASTRHANVDEFTYWDTSITRMEGGLEEDFFFPSLIRQKHAPSVAVA